MYQAKNHANRQIYPFDAILEHIKNNLQSYSNRTIQNNSNNNLNIHDEQQTKNIPQGTGQEHLQKTVIDTRVDNNGIQKDENIVKTRYGRTIRKLDRLSYQ